LAMADGMYATHRLERVDDHTLACRTGGITYVPVPPGTGLNYAGLLSVDLPATVKKGQVFNIVVRQVTNASGQQPPPPPPPPAIQVNVAARRTRASAQSMALGPGGGLLQWRRVLGAFQVAIPVHMKEVLLEPEERLLSFLRWIEEAIPTQNRWWPVFRRYVEDIAGRVRGLGGDPTLIGPSPVGQWRHPKLHPEQEEHEALTSYTGKVEGLAYDRFGDFEGFLLDTEDGERSFRSHEREVEALVHRAWVERILTTVVAERDEPHRPLSIILRGTPPRHGRR
jgi:hypothetical protein